MLKQTEMKYPKGLEQWRALYLQGGLDEERRRRLESWLEESPANREFLRGLEAGGHWREGVRQISYFDERRDWEALARRIVRGRRRVWLRWASVAASAVLVAGAFYWLARPEQTPSPAEMAQARPYEVKLNTASGDSYSLDSAGRIETEGTLLKSNGERLRFKPREGTTGEVEWNTVEVPRGATYKVELGDGTEVELNAESVLHFPNSFEKDGKREIWLEGEAFFSVAADSAHPFVAHTRLIDVEVLGTRFNVMAYDEAEAQAVTLVQGKVKVQDARAGEGIVLRPGMQAVFDEREGRLSSRTVDTSYYTGWRQDLFAFREAPLREVMRALAQWYDFEVFFQNPETQDFVYTGKIKRYETLNEVLENFRQTNELEFAVRGKTVVVSKAPQDRTE